MEVGALGFAHFIGQADVVSQTLLGILIVMSLVSWSIIVIKAFNGMIRRHKVAAFFKQFNTATSMKDLSRTAKHLSGLDYAQLTEKGIEAVGFYHDDQAMVLAKSTTLTDFITITLRAELDEIQMQKENGLSALATIAATAPFVGLFGTVWGIYHALITIGATGAGTIDKVAGPVGEALIMTGIGLAVAIPAVMAYNWLIRRNRVALGRLDTFAFKLIKLLSGHAKEA